MTPLSRWRDARIGLAIDGERVIGEWAGQSWDDVPAGAKLYAQSLGELWPTVHAGNARARLWRPLHKIETAVTGIEYRGRRVLTTRGALDDLLPEEAFEALQVWASFFRDSGANVGSLAGTAFSLWRSTLTSAAIESARDVPTDALCLGGRQGMIGAGTYDHASLWDISAAYSHALGRTMVPRIWRRYTSALPVGFARAEVEIPREAWGPLPIRERKRVVFPVAGRVESVWSMDELRAAGAIGCRVSIRESWGGESGRLLFGRWWRIIEAGRRQLSGPAALLVKASANALWGGFAMTGRSGWLSFPVAGGLPRREWDTNVLRRPRSLTIAALVASAVRARLYGEALALMPTISCHTDGVVLFGELGPAPAGESAGLWRKVADALRIDVLAPQVLRYVTTDGEEVFRVSGVKPHVAPLLFRRVMDSQWRAKPWTEVKRIGFREG